MGQILFWLEASVASVLFVALGLGISSRIPKRRWIVRYFLEITWWPLAVLPLLVAIGGFAAVEFCAGGARLPLIAASVAGGLFIVASVVLSRRAKKPSAIGDGPRASTWRLPRILLAWAAAVVLTGMTLWNLDLAVRQEMTSMRLEAGAIALSAAPSRIPDSQNAALLYRHAWEMLDSQKDTGKDWNKRIEGWLQPEKGTFNPDDKQMLEFLRKQAPIIDLLQKAAELPGCNFGVEYNPPSINMAMPTLAGVRGLGRLLCLSSCVAAHQGRVVDAVNDISAALAISNHCREDPSFIGIIVSIRTETMALESYQYMINQGPLTPDIVNVRHLDPFLNFPALILRSIRLETAGGMSAFAMPEAFSLVAARDIGPARVFLMRDAADPYRVFLWRDDVAAYLRAMRTYERLATLPYYENVREWNAVEWKSSGGVLSKTLTPSLAWAGSLAARADAQNRIFMLGLAMGRYRLAEGAFPSDLGQLVPKYLLAVPVDPFSGKPMKMVQTKEQITIYSIGPDMKDDGGKPIDPKVNLSNNPPPQGDIALTLRR